MMLTPPTRMAVAATLHCLTGCAIGEVLGLALATWWGWSNAASVALAFVLTVPVNRALIVRGRGHAVAHGSHHLHHVEHSNRA